MFVADSDELRLARPKAGLGQWSEDERSTVGPLRKSELQNQERHWSRHASRYDEVFLNPYAPDVENPLWAALETVSDASHKTVADLGCGTGPLLPTLVERFQRVVALDFAPAMLDRARERLGSATAARVTFVPNAMHELDEFAGQLDVAITVNSLVMPDVRLIDRTLRAIRAGLRPGGQLLGIVPAIDAIAYQLMLHLDQALDRGMEARDAERLASLQAERRHYDFAFGRFRFQGLRQKFWQPFEIEHRLGKAGFTSVHLSKVFYPWDDNLAAGNELVGFPRSWDWFFQAR
jgi:SAM-dependent methyltransferase